MKEESNQLIKVDSNVKYITVIKYVSGKTALPGQETEKRQETKEINSAGPRSPRAVFSIYISIEKRTKRKKVSRGLIVNR